MAPIFAQWQRSAHVAHFSVITLGLEEQIILYGINVHANKCFFNNIHYFAT